MADRTNAGKSRVLLLAAYCSTTHIACQVTHNSRRYEIEPTKQARGLCTKTHFIIPRADGTHPLVTEPSSSADALLTPPSLHPRAPFLVTSVFDLSASCQLNTMVKWMYINYERPRLNIPMPPQEQIPALLKEFKDLVWSADLRKARYTKEWNDWLTKLEEIGTRIPNDLVLEHHLLSSAWSAIPTALRAEIYMIASSIQDFVEICRSVTNQEWHKAKQKQKRWEAADARNRAKRAAEQVQMEQFRAQQSDRAQQRQRGGGESNTRTRKRARTNNDDDIDGLPVPVEYKDGWIGRDEAGMTQKCKRIADGSSEA